MEENYRILKTKIFIPPFNFYERFFTKTQNNKIMKYYVRNYVPAVFFM